MAETHWFEDEYAVDPFLLELGFTSLMLAAGEENYPSVLSLLDEGADVNAVSKFGETALLKATRHAYKDEEAALKIIHLLLDRGADINAQTLPEGESSLMRATYYGYIEIVRALLDRGANVNLRRADGAAVLSSVEASPGIARRRKRILHTLREAGAVR